jgi:hypothetical protein
MPKSLYYSGEFEPPATVDNDDAMATFTKVEAHFASAVSGA